MFSVEALCEAARRARREERALDARLFAEQALTAANAGSDPVALIHALTINGQIERDDRKLETALAFYLQAADFARDQSDLLLLAHTIRHAGDIHWAMGDADLAEPCFEEAIALYRENRPAPLDLANALRPLAILKEAVGDKVGAYDLWEEAGELYRTARVDGGVEESARRMAGLSAGP